ncbi:MAG: recombinase family protein, partial [Vicinamibacteria bacterium]
MIAAIYTRVSTDEQRREGHSLDAQARLCRERAESEGYDVPDVYSEALSGAKSDRPEYQRLLADAASGKFEAVYVWKFDRLGRDAEELLRARRMLEAAGVRLVSVTEGEEESNLIYGVRALVAQEEREKISERTRIGLEEVAAGGRALGPAPLGYRHVPGERDRAGRWLPGKEPRWLVHDDEAEIVRRAHELYRAGVGVNRVAATLNEEGYRTRRGSKFSARVILDLLGHPAYIGSVRFRGEIVAEGVHEPILDRETYEEVRRLREARRESPSKGRGRLPKGSHLLTRGMLRCGRCGSAMAPKTSAEGYERYRCGRRRTYGDCAMPDLARARVDEAV